MTKVVPPEKARQGKTGLPVLKVLIAALVIAAFAWAGLSIWGGKIAPAPETTDNAPAQ